jgi:glutathione S-transferase
MLKIHGVPFSAHTRKVIVAAIEKGIPHEIVPVIPLTPPPGWTEISTLGLIPAIQDGDFTLADSSVICQYLDRAYSGASLYPGDAREYARALWIEEFVDGGLAPHVLRGLLMQRVFAPKFLNKAPDEALIHTSLTHMNPGALRLPGAGAHRRLVRRERLLDSRRHRGFDPREFSFRGRGYRYRPLPEARALPATRAGAAFVAPGIAGRDAGCKIGRRARPARVRPRGLRHACSGSVNSPASPASRRGC